ncbi:MAG: DUF1016 N-terminal domain-containing protein [Verrucomicrobia bacterium]|nr:DUF1016 N-terminal domain-containing protein [Verrucomicrobiota bacterium]
MNSDLSILQTSSGLVADVRGMIERTRSQVARVVNAGMTLLYWRIGMRIQTEVLGNERAEYGMKIVSTLSRQLVDDYGSRFSYSALTQMVRFAEAFPGAGIVATLSQQLGWNKGIPEELRA